MLAGCRGNKNPFQKDQKTFYAKFDDLLFNSHKYLKINSHLKVKNIMPNPKRRQFHQRIEKNREN